MITLEELGRLAKLRSYSAEEWTQLLLSCPEWIEQDKARKAADEEAIRLFRIEEEPILDNLEKVGYRLGSVWDLVNTRSDYPAAIPTLLVHLKRPYHVRIREGIIRALMTKSARGVAGPAILDELQHETDANLRWVLAYALTVAADKSDYLRIKALVDDPTFGDVREWLQKAIKPQRVSGKPPKKE